MCYVSSHEIKTPANQMSIPSASSSCHRIPAERCPLQVLKVPLDAPLQEQYRQMGEYMDGSRLMKFTYPYLILPARKLTSLGFS